MSKPSDDASERTSGLSVQRETRKSGKGAPKGVGDRRQVGGGRGLGCRRQATGYRSEGKEIGLLASWTE
jgi:hypothetical protein